MSTIKIYMMTSERLEEGFSLRDHGKKSFESWGITILRMPMRLREGVIAFEIGT